MNRYASMIRSLKTAPVMDRLIYLYGNRDGMLVQQTARYTGILKRHEELFHVADREIMLVSAPGRTEIGGNHTDHNRGCVLAAAVNLDTLAAVSSRGDMKIRLYSEGYPGMELDMSDLSMREEEKGTTAALLRGVMNRMVELGYRVGGFDAAVTSSVASGSGLSSSAAFEVMTVAILDALYNGFTIDYKTRAKISQYAENVYFGKPSGLLDQMASSAGGLVNVDFRLDDPEVRPMSFDFAQHGYALVVVTTGGSHADLTDDYAAIPAEMKQVAAFFHQPDLRHVRCEEVVNAISELRKTVADRALIRAKHFFAENDRVARQVEALQHDDLPAFLDAINESGRSSFMYLQNVYARPDDQSLSLALALADTLLDGRGAWRIHGGGFAGTTLNFVPQEDLKRFLEVMEGAFGKRCCHVLDIRPEGAVVMHLDNGDQDM